MKIFNTPIRINNVEFRNHLVFPPLAVWKCEDGEVTDALVEHYRKITDGGHVGLLITEFEAVSADGRMADTELAIFRDSDVPGLRRLVDAVHANGTKIIAQLVHGGGKSDASILGEPVPVVSAESDIKWESPVKELTVQDILRIEDDYLAAAERAKAAGFDGIELHSAHGFLLNQFFSPLSNKRTDEYGGSLEDRIRIHLEIIRKVKHLIDPDFILALRLGASDYMEGGSTKEDGAAACGIFEEAGVDLLDISGGHCMFVRKGHTEAGYFSELSEAVKDVVHVPVILTGGVRDGQSADRLLQEGKADLIGVGRAITRDYDWPEKNME